MMQDDRWTEGDGELERLLGAANRELREAEFTSAVMTVVRRGATRRRLRIFVIGVALTAGVLLAFGPLVDVATLAVSAARALEWQDDALGSGLAAMVLMYPMPVLAVLLFALGWPAVTRWIAR
jgi:hypothetical protein